LRASGRTHHEYAKQQLRVSVTPSGDQTEIKREASVMASGLPTPVTMLRSGALPVRTSLRFSSDVSGGRGHHGEKSRTADVGG
jgi:hypothetical protein